MTQCEKILAYLDEHGSITTMEGMSKLRIAILRHGFPTCGRLALS